MVFLWCDAEDSKLHFGAEDSSLYSWRYVASDEVILGLYLNTLATTKQPGTHYSENFICHNLLSILPPNFRHYAEEKV